MTGISLTLLCGRGGTPVPVAVRNIPLMFFRDFLTPRALLCSGWETVGVEHWGAACGIGVTETVAVSGADILW